MKIYLIRHGQSIGNTKKGYVSGRTDPDGLTSKGKAQIIRLAWELRQEKIDQIISSPVIRAQESALLLKNSLNLNQEIVTKQEFSELDHGAFEGIFWSDVKNKIPKSWQAGSNPREDFTTPYPQGGESFKQLAERSIRGFEKILKNYKDHFQSIAIVTHNAVVGSILYYIKHQKIPNDHKHFMEYIHQAQVPNGSAQVAKLQKNSLSLISTTTNLEPLKHNQATVEFFCRGLFNISKPQATLLETQSDNRVYRVKSHTKPLLVKFLTDEETIIGRRLVRLYHFLATNTKIQAPKILFYDRSSLLFENEVVVQSYANGQNQFKCLQATHTDTNLFRQILNQLNLIHQLPIPKVENFWYPNDWSEKKKLSWKKFIQTEIGLTLIHIQKFDLDDKTKSKLKKLLYDLDKLILTTNQQLNPLHGDLSPQNVIVDHRGKNCRFVRLVDFERARIGDRVWDYAYYFGWLERSEPKAAQTWKKVIWSHLSREQKHSFALYRFLFHAWTVRDELEYPHSTSRKSHAQRSLSIIKNDLHTSN